MFLKKGIFSQSKIHILPRQLFSVSVVLCVTVYLHSLPFWETSNRRSRLLNTHLHSFYFQGIFFLLPQPPYLNSAMQQRFYFGRRITEVQNEKSHHEVIWILLSFISVLIILFPALLNCFSVVFCTNQTAGWVMLSLRERSLQTPAGLMNHCFISTLWSVLFFIVPLLTGHTFIVPASAEKDDSLFSVWLSVFIKNW